MDGDVTFIAIFAKEKIHQTHFFTKMPNLNEERMNDQRAAV